MGAQPDSDADPRVAEQAAEWLVRLDSQDCTEAERAAFESWQAADPMHAVAYRQAQAMWHDSHAVIRNSMAQIGRATSELQSLMRISYAVFCLKKKKTTRLSIHNK